MASAALHRPREAPHHLRRTDTDEEFERLKKKQETYTMRKQLSEQEAQDAAHEATHNRIVVASAESSAVQQVVSNVAFAAAPGMNQQLRATLEKVLPRSAFQNLAIGPSIADIPVLELAPTLNQQELMVQLSEARTEHWEALSQNQSNTHIAYRLLWIQSWRN